MILIADSGSTKTDWALADDTSGSEPRFFSGPGLNPAVMPPELFAATLAESLDGIALAETDEIHFYGAGCLPQFCQAVSGNLSAATGAGRIEVNTDMLGAARALFGDNPGIAAILGTGSNSCYYDGSRIAANTPPLGYILGDEGSGARLGIALVNAVFKGLLPPYLADAFESETGLTKADVIEHVYRRPGANTFLASLTRFLASHISEEPVSRLVTEEFGRFFDRNISGAYPHGLPVGFVGSLAEVFATQLRQAAGERGIAIGPTLRRPLESLVEFHRKNHIHIQV